MAIQTPLDNSKRKRERRDLALFLLILLGIFACLLIAAQLAILQPGKWQVAGNMLSELDPNSGRGPTVRTGPISDQVMTPVWNLSRLLTPIGKGVVVPPIVVPSAIRATATQVPPPAGGTLTPPASTQPPTVVAQITVTGSPPAPTATRPVRTNTPAPTRTRPAPTATTPPPTAVPPTDRPPTDAPPAVTATRTSAPPSTATASVTSPPAVTNTPTRTASPTISPTPSRTSSPTPTPTASSTPDLPPAAPINLRAAAGDREISLGWNAVSAPDLAGYRVYSSTTGVEPFPPQAVVTVTRYLNIALTNGTRYYYYVTAYDIGNNESPRSNITSAIPYVITNTYPITATCSGVPNCNNALGPPNGTVVDIDGSDVITLDFGAGNGIIDGAGYDLVFYEWPNGPNIEMDFIFLDLSPDGVTWYLVFAWDGDTGGIPGHVYGTNIDSYAADGEQENEIIPGSVLYPGGLPTNTGIAIDIGPWTPAGYAYRYVRFRYPAGGTDAGQIDSVLRLH